MASTARACLVLVTLSSFFAFTACSDDDDDGAGSNVAGETGEAGAASASGGSSAQVQGGTHAGGAAPGEVALECEVLGELCHAADTGTGPAADCHDVGHVGDARECTAQFASCVAICTETDVGAGGAGGASGVDPQCAALGSLCHAAGEIEPNAKECHELGHEGDAAACADQFAACATLCLEVLDQVEEGAGGAASGGAAVGGAGGAP